MMLAGLPILSYRLTAMYVRAALVVLLSSIVALAGAVWGHWFTIGTASAVALLILGGVGLPFVSWRRERGLWMLAGLLVFFPGVYLACMLDALIHPRPGLFGPHPFWAKLDFAAGTGVSGLTMLALASVAVWNWRLTRPPPMADGQPPGPEPDAPSPVPAPLAPTPLELAGLAKRSVPGEQPQSVTAASHPS